MIYRVLTLLFAALLCASASLTWLKAPSLAAWKVAILVGEFGHWLWPFPLFLALAAGRIQGGGGVTARWVTWVLCALALAFLLKPSVQAYQLAQRLPAELAREFGAVEVGRSPFSVSALFFRRRARPVARPQTHCYAHRDGDKDLSLDFFSSVGRIPAPCVVVIHGGGWDSGDRHQFESFNLHLAERGFAVAAIDYRLAPESVWPTQRDDVQAALAYLKKHSAELGIDPTRFVLLGRSAGGQIAEAVAYGQPSPELRGVIALYAPADLYFAWHYTKENDLLDSFRLMRQYLGGTPETVPAKFESASPYRRLGSSGTLPTLLAHGQIDALVWHRQSERLAERLRETKTPLVFLDLPWATHAFDYNPQGPAGQLSGYAIDWFLQAVTR